MRRRRDIPWQRYVEQYQCQSVQSASPVIPAPQTQSKSVVATAIALHEKLVSVHPRSMFCALVIVAGLSMRMLNQLVMSLTTARLASSAMEFVSMFTILLLVMVAYKRANKQKVVW